MITKAELKKRASGLKRDIPAIFLALKDRRTPLTAKLLALFVVIYALSPVDLVPDFIPVLGMLDDLIILPAAAAAAIKLIPADIMAECREKAEGMWKDGKPEKWYYAVPFILFWLLIAALIVKAVFFE